METFSALLAHCAGNSTVTGEFPAQRPVTPSFDVFFDLCLNKRLSKQSWGWGSETLSRLLRCHCNAVTMKLMMFVPELRNGWEKPCYFSIDLGAVSIRKTVLPGMAIPYPTIHHFQQICAHMCACHKAWSWNYLPKYQIHGKTANFSNTSNKACLNLYHTLNTDHSHDTTRHVMYGKCYWCSCGQINFVLLWCVLISIVMMTSSNGNIFRVTGPLQGKSTGHRWIPLTKASNAELWRFLDLRSNKRFGKQSRRLWFETPWRSLLRHCNVIWRQGVD